MFSQCSPGNRRQRSLTWSSVALHLLLLVALVFPRSPMFIAPSSVQRGDRTGSVMPIYFYAHRSPESQTNASSKPTKLYWRRQQKLAREKRAEEPVNQPDQRPQTSEAVNETPAGTPFGSLSTGSLYGQEIRPALPIVSRDPIFGKEELASAPSGSVVVEITIDDSGNITEKRVTQSLTPSIDAKVLAALDDWRFAPATRNGVPIPSKQDVYYHFPR